MIRRGVSFDRWLKDDISITRRLGDDQREGSRETREKGRAKRRTTRQRHQSTDTKAQTQKQKKDKQKRRPDRLRSGRPNWVVAQVACTACTASFCCGALPPREEKLRSATPRNAQTRQAKADEQSRGGLGDGHDTAAAKRCGTRSTPECHGISGGRGR